MTSMLKIEGVSSHYGRIQALDKVDIEVAKGELVACVGANGAGKTTLLQTLSGIRPATEGSIHFSGKDITRIAPDKRVRLGMAHVPEGRQVFGPMTVEDNLKLGGYTRPAAEAAETLEAMYELFPILRQKREELSGNLSGGQQQMLAIARALMSKPDLLLLDEPSMGLAPLMVEEIFAIIADLKSRGITVVLVEQNACAALAVADRGYVMETGRTLWSDSGANLLADDRVKAAYLGM